MQSDTHHDRPFPYTRSRSNKQLQQLRNEGPKLTDDTVSGGNPTPKTRAFIGSLNPPWMGQSVWYVWGDERRAVRLFVETYESEVREEMKKKNNALTTRFSEPIWRMICEEYLWSGMMTDSEVRKYQHREPDDDE